jgi:hypothetical protein
METENKIATPTQKKVWARPEIIIISQGYIEHSKIRTAHHEKSFLGSNPATPAKHFLTFKNSTIFTPVAITQGDFVS